MTGLGLEGVVGTGIASVAVTVSAGYMEIQHLKCMRYRPAQMLLLPILVAPAVLIWFSWIPLALHTDSPIYELVFRFYKVGCFVLFLNYVNQILGFKKSDIAEYSEEQVESSLLKLEYVQHIPPCCCLGVVGLRNREELLSYTTKMQIGMVQFVLISPGVMVTGLLLRYAGRDDLLQHGDMSLAYGWFAISVISAASAAVASYCMTVHCIAVQRMPLSSRFKLLEKFIWIECVVFIPELQTLLIGLLAKWGLLGDPTLYFVPDLPLSLSFLLLCGELLIASFTSILVFPISDYESSNQ